MSAKVYVIKDRTANGYYYALIDDEHFIGIDID